MFDYQVSKHPHFEEACRAFAVKHNMTQLAAQMDLNVQMLRNKLNPAQPHQLTWLDILTLTDITEDPTLVDGFLAQLHCLPCVPVNEVAKEKMPHYVMNATAELGSIARATISGETGTASGRRQAVESINSATRFLALTAVTLHARLQTYPAMTSAVDTVTGLGASFGLI